MFRRFVLDNGVRVVADRMPSAQSVTIGIWVNVGSRDEGPGEEGFSHFIEHMLFKGTSTRSAAQISREIDSLGGEMNAYTGRETTTFYVKVLDRHLSRALELLADVFHHSVFNAKDVEKEKQVVLEEVRMVEDDPEDLVQDLHMEQALKAHPLGRPILGKPSTIQSLRRGDLLRFIGRQYHPEETLIAVAGNFDIKEAIRLLRRSFGSFTKPERPRMNRWPSDVGKGVLIRHKRLQQAHLCLGFKGLRNDHKDRYGLYALNTLIGGGVSSRLFQEVREKRGLAYSIYSYAASFSDTGTFTIYAATRPKQAAQVVEVVRRELRRLHREGIARAEIDRIKEQMKGSLMLNLESTPSRMTKVAKDELYHGRYLSLNEVMAGIDAVSGAQVSRMADELLTAESYSVTALGPISARDLEGAIR